MDSTVEVALAAKLLLLFPPTEDAFLSFPATAAAFTHDDLRIFERPGESAEDVRQRSHRKAQLARVLNQVPHDALVHRTEDRLVWDEYERVLRAAELARSTLTAAEREQLARAEKVLRRDVEQDGVSTPVHTPELAAYYRYKDAHDEVARTLLDERITAEHSEDPAVRATWESGRRAVLEGALARALQDWTVLGHRAVVDEALAVVQGLSGKSLESRRAEMISDLEACVEPDLVANDPEGAYSTFYSPSDAFDPATSWTTLHLSGEELGALVAGAPAELRERVGTAVADLRSVTVEYADVTVMRPWLSPTFLASRTWRLPPGDDEVLSDGATPRRGRLPALVTGMVVVRRVTVEREVPVGAPADAVVLPQLGLLRRAAVLEQVLLRAPATTTVPSTRAALPDTARVLRPAPARRVAAAPEVLAAPVGRVSLKVPEGLWARAGMRERGLTVTRVDLDPVVLQPTAPVAPTPTSRVEEVVLDGVVVAAYRCRRLRRSPDPDGRLDWGEAPVGPPAAVTFPLPDGHAFGARTGNPAVHTGRSDAQEREHVRALQRRLAEVSGTALADDGSFGPRTEQAVRAFQRSRSLTEDGLVGPRTWAALHESP